MSAPIDHKKPAAAFVLLCVVAAAVIGNGARARAEESSLVAEGMAVLRVRTVHGVLDVGSPVSVARVITGTVAPGPGTAGAPVHGAAVRREEGGGSAHDPARSRVGLASALGRAVPRIHGGHGRPHGVERQASTDHGPAGPQHLRGHHRGHP